MIHNELYHWNWSSFGDTAFFYFHKGNKLMCVEYWLDEETVATGWELYTIEGELIEDKGGLLTEEEIEFYTDFCKKEIENSSI